MTDTEVQAQANAIKAEANAIQERYNSGSLSLGELGYQESVRHNMAMESIEEQKNRITSDYNDRNLHLLEQKTQYEQQLAKIEQDLKYANEATKRDLEAQANTISAKVASIQQEVADNNKWYNEQLVGIQEDVANANRVYQEQQVILGGMQNEVNLYKAQSDNLYHQAQIQISEMEQKRADDSLYWNNFWKSQENAMRRDELNSLNTYREAEIQQRKDDRTANVVSSMLGNLASIAGGVFRGMGGVLIEHAAKNSAKSMIDKLFRR